MAAEHLALVETLTSLASVRKSWSGATQGGDFNHGGIGANRSRNLYERQAKRERASTPVRDTELINQRVATPGATPVYWRRFANKRRISPKSRWFISHMAPNQATRPAAILPTVSAIGT
jgi:hypothetical protein